MTKPSHEELRITKHFGSPQIADSASSTEGSSTAKETRSWWLITVSGYGSYAVFGTEEEAEQTRRHKARWEGGVGKKKLIDAAHPQAVNAIARARSDRDRGCGESCWKHILEAAENQEQKFRDEAQHD